MGAKTIRDAVHGDIVLDEPEMEVVDTPAFQRLRGIKQLGTSFLVFPSAHHTRFEHSLGTCWVAKRMLAALRRQSGQPNLLRAQERTLYIAALLHDVTHIPFGHTFEDERRIFPRHDESPERREYFLGRPPLSEILDRQGVRQQVLAVLDRNVKAGEDVLMMREILAGTVCADLLDYLKRDAFFCGLRLDYDERLYRYLTAVAGKPVFDLQHRGLFRPDALSELVHLLRLRYTLTERVYYHHGKVVAGAMISRALELALRAGRLKREELLNLRDDSFLYLLGERCRGDEEASLLLNDLQARRLYRCVYLLRPAGIQGAGVKPEVEADLERRFHRNEGGMREAVESELASRLGLRPAETLVYCPSARMALQEARVPVKIDAGPPVSLSDLRYPEVEVLQEKHRALWRFGVFLRRGLESLAERAGEACEELIGERNMLAERGRE
ncbi:MAG: HD domain-containing protein [Planctomycetes bacterium]|nr:HD domain-containing protein [Planctomycetota bacterium]